VVDARGEGLRRSRFRSACFRGRRGEGGAASPDTPLAYPESGGDDTPAEEEEDTKKPAASRRLS
jgi:hypothetical protein